MYPDTSKRGSTEEDDPTPEFSPERGSEQHDTKYLDSFSFDPCEGNAEWISSGFRDRPAWEFDSNSLLIEDPVPNLLDSIITAVKSGLEVSAYSALVPCFSYSPSSI